MDTSLPPPLDKLASWLLKTEGTLTEEEEEEEAEDHSRAADEAKEKQQLLKVSFFFSLKAKQQIQIHSLGVPEGLSGGDASAPEDLPGLPEHGPLWKHAGSL